MFDFWPKWSIFDQNGRFLPKFGFLPKISILDQNLAFYQHSIWIFAQNFNFWPKFSIIDQYFNFWRKFGCLPKLDLWPNFSINAPNFGYFKLWLKYDSLKNSLQSTWTATKDHDGFDGFNPELHGTCSNDEDRACPCSTEDFAPVCANMSVDQGHWKRITFFSPCHLGCRFDRLQRTIKVDAIQKRTTDIQSMVDDCKCAGNDFWDTSLAFPSRSSAFYHTLAF